MAPAKASKHRLTINQLAAYDDILTDALIDHTYYWTTVPKNKQGYHPSRGLKEEQIAKIIQTDVIVNKDMAAAETHLLETPGLRAFFRRLSTNDERQDFLKHLRRYISVFRTDCPFEIITTNRYTVTSHEAAISAKRAIKKGERIKYLTGIQVVLTPEEEKDIMARKKDFSIVISARHKHTSLFMGPARFANHDCNANARLVTCSQAGIEIVANRDIGLDEEITVTYSDNYFGQDNCECLCKTCEDNLASGWSNPEAEAVKKAVEEASSSKSYSLRKRKLADRTGSITALVAADVRPTIRKTIRRARLSTAAASEEPSVHVQQDGNTQTALSRAASSQPSPNKRRKIESSHAVISALSPCKDDDSSASSVSVVDKIFDEDRGGGTDVTTPEFESGLDHAVTVPDTTAQSARGKLEALLNFEADREPQFSIHLPDMALPSIESPAALLKHESPKPDSADAPARSSRFIITHATALSSRRVPGDYTLTPVLLSTPTSSWVTCTVCAHPFVQQEAYYTRRECYRCERHSKLYGYMWPKTDPTGEEDEEERVLDHRTVHRYLSSQDERRIRGKDRIDFSTLRQGWEEGNRAKRANDSNRNGVI